MFDVNVFGGLELAQGLVKKIVTQKKPAKIVFTTYMGGLWTVPYVAAYCASKHANVTDRKASENMQLGKKKLFLQSKPLSGM